MEGLSKNVTAFFSSHLTRLQVLSVVPLLVVIDHVIKVCNC